MVSPENRGNFLSRNWGKLAAVASLAGAVALAPKGWSELQDWQHPESDIVAGVPAQVSGHSWEKHCTLWKNGLCMVWNYDYFLQVEQCPQDIEAARRGEITHSFHPDPAIVYEGCVVDFVHVSEDTYAQTPDSAAITFAGPVGGTLRK